MKNFYSISIPQIKKFQMKMGVFKLDSSSNITPLGLTDKPWGI